MNNFHQSDDSPVEEAWSPQESPIIYTRRKSPAARFIHWWHSFASPPEPPEDATVPQREKYRRARTVSVVALVFSPMLAVGALTSLTMPNPWLFQVCLAVVAAFVIAPFVNRAGHVLIAGLLVTIPLQFVMIYFIMTTTPLNETALQIYDLFVLVILLAIAVLPPRAIWIIAILDSVFIVIDLSYQPRTQEFTNLLAHEGFIGMLVRPIILILFLTGVATFLLRNVSEAVRKNYEAEFVANLERATAQQNEIEAETKRVLEESIQQIVQAHTDIMNGRVKEHISYPTSKALWPLVGILNTLWTRLQRAQHRDQELAQLQEAIMAYNETIQRSMRSPEQPLTPYQTKTALDPLTLSLTILHRELLHRLGNQTKRNK